MYKLLLCWRYLKTRYLAMACIISVMLGVATLIVVNSVMSGFSTKLRDRLHALLSDVVIEAHGMEGFGDPQGKMERIRKHPYLGGRVEAMATTLEVFAMLQFHYPNGEPVARPVRLIGVDPEERSLVGGFKEYLASPANRGNPTFALPEEAEKHFRKTEEDALPSGTQPASPYPSRRAAPARAAADGSQDSSGTHRRQPYCQLSHPLQRSGRPRQEVQGTLCA